MSMQFKVIFQRYRTRDGDCRLSVPQFIHAEDFDRAHFHAGAVLFGMKSADTESRYSIASIEAVGLRGKECDGALMWETQAELVDRVGEG